MVACGTSNHPPAINGQFNYHMYTYMYSIILATVVYVPFPFLQVSDSQYTMGHAVLNGVDFRCHGLTEYLHQERVEYAWLMQLHVGRIAGAFSTQQVRNSN